MCSTFSFYCGSENRGCEDYTYDTAVLTLSEDKAVLHRKFKEGDHPWSLVFLGPLSETTKKVPFKLDSQASSFAGGAYKSGQITIQMSCESLAFEKCEIESSGELLDWKSKDGSQKRNAKQDSHVLKFKLSCNREKLFVREASVEDCD